MYFKRFAQLFVIFLIAGVVLAVIVVANVTGNIWLSFALAVIVAYVILILPLVVLTIAKSHKKAAIVGTQEETGELSRLLVGLPGFIALAVRDDHDRTSTTIMSFTQSVHADNVFYMVAERDTAKARDLSRHPEVSFTTWFDSFEHGARLSSNRATVELFGEPEVNKTLIAAEPNILDIHENAANMAIIRLTIHSVLYEDFKDGLRVIDFEK